MKYLKRIKAWHIYFVVAIFMVASYFFVRQLMIDQSAWGIVMSSPITFNIIIMFGLWGGLHSFIIKVKNPYLDKVVLVLGFIVIVVVLRLLGLQTIFG